MKTTIMLTIAVVMFVVMMGLKNYEKELAVRNKSIENHKREIIDLQNRLTAADKRNVVELNTKR